MKTLNYITVAATALILASSCSKWTEQEPITITYTTLQEKNPELYEAYFQSIRDYRETAHKVMIVKYDNTKASPEGRADHLTCVPDSVDYVILTDPAVTGTYFADEMDEIRTQKGIRTLMQIDVDAMEARYDAIIEEENARAEEDESYEAPGDTPERFEAWMGAAADEQIALIGKNGFDGVNVLYSGYSPVSLHEAQREELKVRQEVFFSRLMAWADANKDALLFFEGKPKNILVDEDVLGRSRYILIPAQDIHTTGAFTDIVLDNLDETVPSDKFIVTVTTLSIDDETDTKGSFEDGGTAIMGAAWWMMENYPSFVKAGMAVEHGQNDYYNSGRVFPNINGAIAVMNPSPLK